MYVILNLSRAVELYNRCLHLHGAAHPVLCGNRAAALMRRRWDGDVYGALRLVSFPFPLLQGCERHDNIVFYSIIIFVVVA